MGDLKKNGTARVFYLEYANQVWAPRHAKHIIMLENVQRRATKLVPSLANLEYEDRLKRLNLPSLAYRRLRGDLIEVYKIMSGKYDAEACEGLIVRREGERSTGHPHKIFNPNPTIPGLLGPEGYIGC